MYKNIQKYSIYTLLAFFSAALASCDLGNFGDSGGSGDDPSNTTSDLDGFYVKRTEEDSVALLVYSGAALGAVDNETGEYYIGANLRGAGGILSGSMDLLEATNHTQHRSTVTGTYRKGKNLNVNYVVEGEPRAFNVDIYDDYSNFGGDMSKIATTWEIKDESGDADVTLTVDTDGKLSGSFPSFENAEFGSCTIGGFVTPLAKTNMYQATMELSDCEPVNNDGKYIGVATVINASTTEQLFVIAVAKGDDVLNGAFVLGFSKT